MALLSKINIAINQKPLKSFQQVTINQNLYGIDSFEITCRYDALEDLDGFLVEKSKDFLGFPIVIQTKFMQGTNEKDGLNFLGYVTEIQSSRSAMADRDEVIISGSSKEIILNRKPTNRAFLDNTLDEIVREVLKDYELRPKINARNKTRFPYIVQFEESDLEFLKRLSIRYGEWFFFDGSEMIFGEIPEVERNLTIGNNLNDFRYELRVAPVHFSLYSVDPLTIKDVYKYKSGNSKTESNLNVYGKHALNMSKKVFSLEGKDYYEHLNVDESEYKKGLDTVGEIQESVDAINLTDISGTSTNGFLAAGNYVKVNCPQKDGKGTLNYGKYLLTSVQHVLDNTLTYQNHFSAIPAETDIPENTDPYFVRSSSNQLGMVADNRDPKKLGRIRISFWWMENKYMTPWVKVVTPYTHVNCGIYFVPALNSRVLVGFEDGDVEKPYCLGTLFDENTCPDPEWAGNKDEKNAKIHAIRTQRGQTIEFHDENGAEKIRIYDTDGNNELELDSANKKIKIRTSGSMNISVGGTLKINAGNIEISSDGNITMKSGDKLEQNATDINSEATASLKQKATSIETKADATYKAEGGATAEISSGGQTVVKGGMVMIN